MIPKIIHWCWLSGDPLPDKIKNCIDSWKICLPDYEIKCWTTQNFDINSIEYVREAFEQKKWAFCADYIRAYALFTEGGIYLDSDVQVLKSFNDLLHFHFFSSVEYIPDNVKCFDVVNKCLDTNLNRLPNVDYVQGIGIQAAIMGAEKGNEYMSDCLAYYRNLHFSMNKGYDNMAIVAPNFYAVNAEKYGFRYKNEDQYLDNNMVIFKDEVFCVPEFMNHRTYALHLVAHSWYNPTLSQKIYQSLAQIKFLKRIFDWLENSKCTRNMIALIKKNIWLK